jgi:uncharacterized membrane protein HdeD (DUF308 family)
MTQHNLGGLTVILGVLVIVLGLSLNFHPRKSNLIAFWVIGLVLALVGASLG